MPMKEIHSGEQECHDNNIQTIKFLYPSHMSSKNLTLVLNAISDYVESFNINNVLQNNITHTHNSG